MFVNTPTCLALQAMVAVSFLVMAIAFCMEVMSGLMGVVDSSTHWFMESIALASSSLENIWDFSFLILRDDIFSFVDLALDPAKVPNKKPIDLITKLFRLCPTLANRWPSESLEKMIFRMLSINGSTPAVWNCQMGGILSNTGLNGRSRKIFGTMYIMINQMIYKNNKKAKTQWNIALQMYKNTLYTDTHNTSGYIYGKMRIRGNTNHLSSINNKYATINATIRLIMKKMPLIAIGVTL